MWDCCYDPRAQISCFLAIGDPSRSENKKTEGMKIAGAVFLTMFMFSLPALGFLLYTRFISRGGGGFSNPLS